jgi:hypothetical protein|tara:strand:- start:703 stop:825 length:123 start_codon:yes stop_codon:yes gene_type:complete
MKMKAIAYQNNPKKVHGSLEKINWFGLQHDFVYEKVEKKR